MLEKVRLCGIMIVLAAFTVVLSGCGKKAAERDAAPGVTPPAQIPVARLASPPPGHVSGAMHTRDMLRSMAGGKTR